MSENTKNTFFFNSIDYVETDEQGVDYEILATSLDLDGIIAPTTLSEPCSSSSTKIEKKSMFKKRNVILHINRYC